MILVYTITFICIIFQAIRGIPDTINLFSVIERLKNKSSISHAKNTRKWFILLPLFEEQKIAKETISYLLTLQKENPPQLVVVTSDREKGDKTTFEIILKAIESKEWKNDTDRITLLKEPNQNSSMATQLNFAVNEIVSLDPDNKNNFFVLYNADSRPSPETLSFFNQRIDTNSKGSNVVMQQPCAFVKDMNCDANQFVNALSIYQTWFCLGHEMRLLETYENRIFNINENRNLIPELMNSPLGYCVGHGSSMKFKTLLEQGGYPEDFLAEDLTLGYFLSAHQVPICTISALEIGDVPLHLGSYIKQSSVWFWNYVEYIKCFFDKKVSSISFSRRLALVIVGIGRGLYWFFLSFFYIFPFIVGIWFIDLKILLIGFFGLSFFQLLPILYLMYSLPYCLEKQNFILYANKIRKISKLKTILMIIPIIFIDSLGPFLTIMKCLWYLPQGKHPKKYKTER